MNEHVSTAIDALLPSVFDVDPQAINDRTRRGDLEQWDSLGHLRLVAALRDTFRVEIPPEEALDMETVADIKRIVRALLTDVRAS